MYIRAGLAALAILAMAAPAAALEPADVTGLWTTQWANGADQPIDGGGPMSIALENEDALDGLLPTAGQDGVMHGQGREGENGALIWSGAWVSIWPEGVSRGTFRFVFTDADTFTGVWSSDDGAVKNAAWNGRRSR